MLEFLYEVYVNDVLIGTSDKINDTNMITEFFKSSNYYNQCLDVDTKIDYKLVNWPGQEVLDLIRS